MGDLSGQTAAVVGAGRGLGRAAALVLAREGAGVVIASRTASQLDAVAADIAREGGGARAVIADASLEPDAERIVAAAIEMGGTLDQLLVCAGAALIIGFSRALALEVKAQGVRVACLAPAPMDTPMRWAATPTFDPSRLISTDAVVDLVLYLTRHPEVTLEDPVVPISIRL